MWTLLRQSLMGFVWYIVIWKGSQMLVGGVIGGVAGAGKGAVAGSEAGRAASAAFFQEYGWLFPVFALLISSLLFRRLPGTKPQIKHTALTAKS